MQITENYQIPHPHTGCIAVEEATDAEVRRNYDTNVFGLLNVCRAVLPYMRKVKSGHVINLSSVGGLTGVPGWGDFTVLQSSLLKASDYAATVGNMRNFATQVNHKQPGSAVKLAQAILKLAHSQKPPVHLPLGKDTLKFFGEKMDRFNAEIKEWNEVITSTDHEDATA